MKKPQLATLAKYWIDKQVFFQTYNMDIHFYEEDKITCPQISQMNIQDKDKSQLATLAKYWIDRQTSAKDDDTRPQHQTGGADREEEEAIGRKCHSKSKPKALNSPKKFQDLDAQRWNRFEYQDFFYMTVICV